MFDNPTLSVPAHKVYRVKLYSKYSSRPFNYSLKPDGLWNVGLLGVRLSSIHCRYISKLSNSHLLLPFGTKVLTVSF